MRVVVTGGAGFIGANAVRALTRVTDLECIVIDDLSSGSLDNLDGLLDVDIRVGSILDEHVLDAAFKGADAIVHLAAVPSVQRSIDDPWRSHEANATGTLNVLHAARRAGNVYSIIASSSSVYGSNTALPKREDLHTSPLSPYAASKLAAESYALAWGHCFNLPVLPLRFFNVFGPRQPANHSYAAVIPAFVSAAMSHEPLRIFGDGFQTRDFTFVDNVTNVLVEAVLRRTVSGSPINLAFGSRMSLLETAAVLETIIDRRLERVHLPARPGDVRHSEADCGRLMGLFPGLKPVSFERGLRATVEWFAHGREHGSMHDLVGSAPGSTAGTD